VRPALAAAGAVPADSASVGERAVRGVLTLGLREGVMKLLAFGGDIALYRLLTPADFGVIVPVAFLAGMAKQFADLGLQPSLIQRAAEPSPRDLRAVFTAQLALVTLAAAVVVLAGPSLVAGLLGNTVDPWLIRVFALSILFSALRIVPAALLERHLRFGRLATADIAGTLTYYAAGIGFAIGAAGVWSLAFAHVGASVTATAVLLALRPWPPIPTIRLGAIRPLISFGSRYQGARLALMLKDALIPLFAPRAFGARDTGLLSWADKIAAQPLTPTQLVARVSLPAFARIQAEPDAVRRGAELTLKWNAIVTLPAFAAVVAFGPEIARYIYGEAWVPAVPALYVLTINAMLVPVNGLITPVLNALGRTRIVLAVALAWAALAWVVATVLTSAGLGFMAVPAGLVGTQALAAAVLLPLAHREFGLRLLRHLGKPTVAALVAGGIGRLVLLPLLTDAVLLVQGGLVVVLVYAGVLYGLDRAALRTELAGLLARRRTGRA